MSIQADNYDDLIKAEYLGAYRKGGRCVQTFKHFGIVTFETINYIRTTRTSWNQKGPVRDVGFPYWGGERCQARKE